MYTEEYNSNYTLRSLLIKIFLIITIIIILIWIVPKFLSYKKDNKQSKKVVQNVEISTKSLNRLEQAGLKYFTTDKLPKTKSTSKKVTLKELKKNNIIKNISSNNVMCDVDRSYSKITKMDDDYILKSYLRCGNKSKYSVLHVSDYEYCDKNTLCEKDDSKTKKEDINDDNKESQVPDTKNDTNNHNLSNFTEWSSYEKTSCETKEVTCQNDDVNCLKEVKIYTRKEEVGEKTTPLTTSHTALKYLRRENKTVCSNYNYVVINNNIYRTTGNYEEILKLGKTSTNSWTYRGQIETTTTPVFGGNEYYKYVGSDGNNHYYDSYKYNYSMEKVNTYITSCTNKVVKSVGFYTVYKQQETYNIKEKVYATVCYQSTRTRTYK